MLKIVDDQPIDKEITKSTVKYILFIITVCQFHFQKLESIIQNLKIHLIIENLRKWAKIGLFAMWAKLERR